MSVGKRSAGSRPAKRMVLRAIATIAIVAAVAGVTAALGGFATAAEPTPPAAKIGEPVDAGRFELTIERAWTAVKDPTEDPEYADDGNFLVVELTAKVLDHESTQSGADLEDALAITLPSGRTIDGDEIKDNELIIGIVLAGDGTDAQLHPGLPRKVKAVFKLPAKEKGPKELDVTVHRMFQTPGFLETSLRWRVDDANPIAGIVPVTIGPAPKSAAPKREAPK